MPVEVAPSSLPLGAPLIPPSKESKVCGNHEEGRENSRYWGLAIFLDVACGLAFPSLNIVETEDVGKLWRGREALMASQGGTCPQRVEGGGR